MKKLLNTLRILFTLMLARTFGTYEHTVWDGKMSYARYQWRGKVWAFPTEPIEDWKSRRLEPFSNPSDQRAFNILERDFGIK